MILLIVGGEYYNSMLNTKLLINTNIHREAIDWHNRVITNGGRVSKSTLKAVSDFCNRIDAAGIRDKFYRLNLFCGTGLNSCLVPLYRGPSLTGSQGGLTVDSNNGPFVSGDYSETTGLTGNGTTKHLRIGTLQSVYQGVLATGHMSVWTSGRTENVTKRAMGIFDLTLESGQPYLMGYAIPWRAGGTYNFGRNSLIAGTTPETSSLLLINRSSTTALQLYINSSSVASSATESINRDIPDASITVFGQSYYNWNNNTFTHGYETPQATFSSYSCGLSMTSTQVTAYYNALLNFRQVMGRI